MTLSMDTMIIIHQVYVHTFVSMDVIYFYLYIYVYDRVYVFMSISIDSQRSMFIN